MRPAAASGGALPLLLALAAPPHLAAAAPPAACPWATISDLTRNVSWALPDTVISPVPVVGGTMELNHTRFGHLSVCNLTIGANGGPPGDSARLTAHAQNLSFAFSSFVTLKGEAEGSGTVSLRGTADAQLGVRLSSPGDMGKVAPTNISVEACSLAFSVFDLTCTGDLQEACHDLVTPATVNSTVCGMLLSAGGASNYSILPSLTELLQKVSALLAQYDVPPPPGESPSAAEAALAPSAPRLFNFSNSTGVVAARAVADGVYGARAANGTVVAAEVVRRFWPHASVTLPGALLGGLSELYTGTIAGLFDLNVTLVNISASGFDTINRLDLLRLAGNYSTAHTVGFADLRGDLWLRLSLGPSAEVSVADDQTPLVELVHLTVSLRDAVLNATALAALDKHIFAATHVGGLAQAPLGCLLKPVEHLDFLSFVASVRSISVMAPDAVVVQPPLGRDAAIAGFVTAAAEAVLLLYGSEVAGAIPYLSQTRLRPILSEVTKVLLFLETKKPHACAMTCQTALERCAAARALGRFYCDACVAFHRSALKDAGCPAELLGPWCEGKGLPLPAPIDYNTSRVARALTWAADDFMAVGTDYDVNALLRELGRAQSGLPGTFRHEAPLVRQSLSVVAGIDLGSLSVELSEAALAGVDTLGSFAVLQPSVVPSGLDNSLRWRGDANASLRLQLNWTGTGGDDVRDDLRLSLRLSRLNCTARLVARVLDTPLAELAVGSLEDTGCLLSTFDKAAGSLQAAALQLGTAAAELGADCVTRCSSPQLQQLPAMLSSQACKLEITHITQRALAAVARQALTEPVQELLDERVAAAQCPTVPLVPTPAPTDEDRKAQADMAFRLLVTIPISITVLWCIAQVVTGMRTDPEIIERNDRLRDHALFHHDVVPPTARVLIPFGIVTSIAGFLVACTTVGIKSGVKLRMAGSEVPIEDVFDLGLASSVSNLWQARVYFFGVVTALASGAWPYVRGTLLLFAWFAPVHIVSSKTRYRILAVMDFAGKWSMVNIFVFINLVVSFHLKIQTPGGLSCIPGGFGEMELIIVPQGGFFAMLYGVIASLAANRMQLVYQRNSQVSLEEVIRLEEDASEEPRSTGLRTPGSPRAGSPPPPSKVSRTSRVSRAWSQPESSASWFMKGAEDLHKEAIIQHRFRVSESDGLLKRVAIAKGTRWCSVVLLIASLLLTVAGAVIVTFEFDFHGLPRVALEAIEPGSSKSDYGIFTIASALMGQAEGVWGWSGHVGYGVTVFFFVLFAVVIPVLQLIMLGVSWLVPMPLRITKLVVFNAGLLAAGSAVEVFIVSLFASLSQISQFATFLVNDKCSALAPYFQQIIHYGILSSDDAQCFDVHAKLKDGFGVLLAGAVMYNLVYLLLLYTSELAIADRERDGGRCPSSRDPSRLSHREEPKRGSGGSLPGPDIITIQFPQDGLSPEGRDAGSRSRAEP